MMCTGEHTSLKKEMELEQLKAKPLAFSCDNSLVSASSRAPLYTKDGALLNIELFLEGTDDMSPILLFIHGVCASIETLGVQAIVSAAKENGVKVAVLELEGHGLSSGPRAVCGSFRRLLNHVLEFVQHSVQVLRGNNNILTHSEAWSSPDGVPFFLSGNSLGGVLSIYASETISQNTKLYPFNFKGLAAICPAVGVDSNKVPSSPIVFALSLLSTMAPTLRVPLTPLEDPKSYNCPMNSKRNFSGHWPLATSKMLLDVTSTMVQSDLSKGVISLKSTDNVLLFAGEVDDTVPYKSTKQFFDSISSRKKELISVNGGHDMMVFQKTADVVTSALFTWVSKNSK